MMPPSSPMHTHFRWADLSHPLYEGAPELMLPSPEDVRHFIYVTLENSRTCPAPLAHTFMHMVRCRSRWVFGLSCVCAWVVVRKANSDDRGVLDDLVRCVRLEKSKCVVPDKLELHPGRPSAATTPDYSALFNAVLDPLFDEEAYVRSKKLYSRMPLGDTWLL